MMTPGVIIKSAFTNKKGSGISPIRAVIFALAGTLGVGNIVGVASAIALGGAGAVALGIAGGVVSLSIIFNMVNDHIAKKRKNANK